ncbi:MAG: polysaccharide deacetylase family protein [Cyanobacteria bacterium P01_A01_bin.84]
MEKNKSFVWQNGILIGLTILAGTLGLGLMMPLRASNLLQLTNFQAVDSESIEPQIDTQKRIEGFKTAMLSTWQQQATAKGVYHTVPKQFHGKTIKSASLPSGKKAIALTFDDGPWKGYTAQVLDILKKNNVKATFFVVGQMLKIYPDLGKRIVGEGHAIGNHTWHHWYHQFSKQAAAFEIDRTNDLIYQVTGTKTTLFRPPGGILHNGLAAYAKSQNKTVVMWSADSVDYSRPSPATLVSRVMKQSSPGGIVLMHDGGGNRANTVAALPSMIQKYKEKGYIFVTVPELLEMQNKQKKVLTSQKKK